MIRSDFPSAADSVRFEIDVLSGGPCWPAVVALRANHVMKTPAGELRSPGQVGDLSPLRTAWAKPDVVD